MVRRIRIVLCFQAERAVLLVCLATLADDTGIQMNGGVELHASLGGPDFHPATSGGIVYFSGESQRTRLSIHNEIVIVAADLLDFADVRTDRRGLAEIEWRAGHAGDLARWDERGIDGCVIVRMQFEDVL